MHAQPMEHGPVVQPLRAGLPWANVRVLFPMQY